METARPLLTLLFCLSALLLLFSVATWADEDDARPVEFGGVAWLRDFDAALEQAQAKERSILLLFQEVPG